MRDVALSSSVQPGGASPERAELRQAAQAFEAIFLRQMLATARSSTLGEGNDLLSGPGLDQFNAMLDEQFADLAAKGGALGLADQIEAQLASMLRQKEA